jgi:hypothetical protein
MSGTTRIIGVLLFLLLCAINAMAVSTPVVCDDRDWRDANTVTKSEGLERALAPELLLKTEMKEPVLLFDPTTDETITYLTDFQGRLYIASCTQPAATDTGSIFTYDPDTNQWQKVFQVNDQGLTRLEVFGNRMYIAGYDANDGGWDLGNIYIHDGKNWVEHRTVPRAIHEYGLAVYKGRIYVSADILDPPPAGMSVEDAAEKGRVEVYSRVVSSGDDGKTWREEFRAKDPGQYTGILMTFHDQLLFNHDGDLYIFDGKRWKALCLNPSGLIVLDYADAGDVLLLGTSLGLGFYDGKHFRLLKNIPFARIHAVRRLGSSWLLAEYVLTGGTTQHGPGLFSYPSTGGEVRPPYWSGYWIISDNLMRKALRGDLPRKIWWNQAQRIPTTELLTSAHVFRGRVYLGTHPEGRVLVLPVIKEGMLESAPHAVVPGKYELSWQAATPAGTSCKLQIRAAATCEALEKQPFVGPEGTAKSFYDTSSASINIAAAGFVQYRILLHTDNPALTPYLKRVTLQ